MIGSGIGWFIMGLVPLLVWKRLNHPVNATLCRIHWTLLLSGVGMVLSGIIKVSGYEIIGSIGYVICIGSGVARALHITHRRIHTKE